MMVFSSDIDFGILGYLFKNDEATVMKISVGLASMVQKWSCYLLHP
jgi:hypothetical protein